MSLEPLKYSQWRKIILLLFFFLNKTKLSYEWYTQTVYERETSRPSNVWTSTHLWIHATESAKQWWLLLYKHQMIVVRNWIKYPPSVLDFSFWFSLSKTSKNLIINIKVCNWQHQTLLIVPMWSLYKQFLLCCNISSVSFCPLHHIYAALPRTPRELPCVHVNLP